MKIRQKEQGITLVALIITIIILIILAAVTINAAFNNNLIGIATKGTENYAIGQVDESKKMDDIVEKLEDTLSNLASIQAQNGGTGGGGTSSGGGDTPPTPEEPEKPPVELPEAGTAVPTEGWSVEVAKGLVARDGLVAHIGEIVDYNPPAGGTWRIFYYDNEDQGNGKGYFGDPVGTVYLKRDYDENTTVDLTDKGTYSPKDNGKRFYQHNPLWEAQDNGMLDLDKEKACSYLLDESNWAEYMDDQTALYAVGGARYRNGGEGGETIGFGKPV